MNVENASIIPLSLICGKGIVVPSGDIRTSCFHAKSTHERIHDLVVNRHKGFHGGCVAKSDVTPILSCVSSTAIFSSCPVGEDVHI